ncbi:GNAT family N-acetyltransferase [Microbacterium sp.]|uniref:GNAT family N-acetyltransferase n=1 Tax=Microbacterium sp. TaxID=51671 RepID=UPI003F9712CB
MRTPPGPTESTSAVEVRRGRDQELEEVVGLRWHWTTLDRGESPAITEEAFVTGAARWAREHADTHLPHVAVTKDGSIIGMAWLALTPRVASTHSFDRSSGDLQSCYVLPSFRRQGIGGRLVQAVLDTAAAHGAEHVTVHTSADSPGMYLRNGFRANSRLLFADSTITER